MSRYLERLFSLAALAVLGIVLAGCARQPAAPKEITSTPGAGALRVLGQLTTEGVECQALRADTGTLYTLVGDLKGFRAGDKVVVDGTPVQMSFCMQGTTLRVTQITRRPDDR